MSAVIRIHPADDVVIARRQLLGRHARRQRGHHGGGPGAAGPQDRGARDRRRRAGAALQPDHRLRDASRSRPASTCTRTTWRSRRSSARTRSAPACTPTAYVDEPATFMGIVRDDGRIATRNYIGVLTSVNCSATAARAIADQFRRDIHPEALADYPNVDGVVALTHGAGCATASDGEELLVLRRTLGGYAKHANFAAVLVVGPRLRDQPDPGPDGARGPGRRRAAAGLQHPGHRRHRQDGGARRADHQGPAEGGQPRQAPAGAGEPHHGGPAVRRLRRLLGHQRQPGARCGGRPAGAPRRQRDPVGDARDLRRRTPADAARREPGGGRQAAGAHPLVGGLHRAQQHVDGQQPVGRQQGGRPDDDPREVARRDRQERHHQPGRRGRVRRKP